MNITRMEDMKMEDIKMEDIKMEDMKMEKITKDMIISEVLEMDIRTAPIFMSNGMYCLGCPSSSGESLEDACFVHGLDADKLVSDLNEYFEQKTAAV